MSDCGDMGGNGSDDMGGSACGDMDSGNSVQGAETAVGGETTAGFEDKEETEKPDSAYSTLVNTPASSTETIYNDCDSAMDVDDEVASNSTVQASDDVASNMGLRCGGCNNYYDRQTHVVSVGECGHEQCSSCWGQSNLCSSCFIYSQNMEPTLPRSGKDMMSPEPIDEPREAKAISMSKGVLLKSSTHNNNNLGVLKPLTGVKLKPCQPSAQASSAIAGVRIKCMDGRNLDEKINPSTTTVGGLKRTINQKMGISSERQHLLHQGKTMTDARTLHSYNVTNGSTIQMAERCSGG